MPPERLTRDIDLGGVCLPVSTYFRQSGQDLILALHGLGCSKETFSEMWYAPELGGWSILAPDFPGFGDTPAPSDFVCDMESLATVAMKLVDDFFFRRLHIVGHSMGGLVGLLMADQSDSVASFVNIEGNLAPEDCGMISRRTAGTPFDEFVLGFDKVLEIAGTSADPGLRLWAALAAGCDRRAFHQACQSMVSWSDSGRLIPMFKGMTAPRVYMYGQRSVLPDVLARLGSVPDFGVPDCGHMVMIERPDRFHATLVDFLKIAELAC